MIMRNLEKARLALLASLCLFIAGSAAAQSSVTSSVDAEIVAAATIADGVNQLNFGLVDAGTGGTITVAPDSSVNENGGNAQYISGATAADFDVTGAPNQTLVITLPASTSIDDGQIVPATMTVNNFTETSGTGTITLDGSGNGSFNVGADLVVGSGQTAGTYSGTYDVSVDYQ